jgi:hypothetical protein
MSVGQIFNCYNISENSTVPELLSIEKDALKIVLQKYLDEPL